MKWSNLPPLSSLRAFAALAETKNYSQAGEALNITHAAVIQHVRALERRLGVTLAVRDGRGVKLTSDGVSLANDLEAGFAVILNGVEGVRKADYYRPVQVTMSPAFAVSWLMPRLPEFQKQHRDITLLLNPTSEIVEPKRGGIDLAIRYSDKRCLSDQPEIVLVADMVVVGTPALVSDNCVTTAADLIDLPWLQELGTNEVIEWMARHGTRPDKPLKISHMPGNLIMEAVRRGDGVTYTARPFIDADIRAGRLIELFSEPAFGIYHIKTCPGILRRPVEIFVQWLKQQSGSHL